MASKSLLLVVPFLLLVSSAVAFDIAKILEDYTEYSTFLKYLADTKLSDEIANRPAVTVLVVDNSAISSLSSLSGDALKKAVGMHILLDYYDPYELDRLHTTATTLNSISGPVAYTQPGKETMMFGNPSVELIKVVAARPYNLSVLQVSSVVTDSSSGSSTPAVTTSAESESSPAPAAAGTNAEAPKTSAANDNASATEAPKASATSAIITSEAPKASIAPSSTTEAPKSSAPSTAESNEKSPAEAPKTDATTPSSAPKSSSAATAPAEAPKTSTTASTPTEAPETSATTTTATTTTGEAPASGGVVEPAEGPEGSATSPVAGGPLTTIASPPVPEGGAADAPAPGAAEADTLDSGAARALATLTSLGLAMGAAVLLVAL